MPQVQLAVLGNDGTVGGAGGSPLTSAGVNGGALTGNAGRTSTLSAPVLRDFVSVLDYAGVANNGKTYTVGASVSGTTFTDVTNSPAPFVVGDVGKAINIPGAGTSGRNFSTTISAFISSTSVTLTAAPPNSGGVTGAYQYGTNCTSGLATAEADLAAAGGGALWWAPGTYLWSSYLPQPGITRMGWGASCWALATGGTSGSNTAMWSDLISDNVTVRTGGWWFGFNLHGEGQIVSSNQTLSAVRIQQWSRVVIRECVFDGFPDSACTLTGGSFYWLLDNYATNCGVIGQRNTFNIAPGPGTSDPGDVVVRGNITGVGLANAALGIITLSGALSRVIITGNDFVIPSTSTNGSACIYFEINSYNAGAGESTSTRVIVANNNLINNSTGGSSQVLTVVDDGANPFADNLKIDLYAIIGNYCACASNAGVLSTAAALGIWASHTIVANNIVQETGTRGQCFFTSQAGSANTTGLKIQNNIFNVTNAAATNAAAKFRKALQWEFSGNTINSSSTVTGDGVYVDVGANACQYWTIQGNTINTVAGNGLNLQGFTDGRVLRNIIYNPNAQNSASSSVGNGINIPASATGGTLNQIEENTIYDDRGTHQMRFAINNSSTTTPQPTLRRNTMQGALSGITNDATRFSDVRGNITDTPNAFPAAPSNPSMPASTVAFTWSNPYDANIYITGGTGTVVTFTRSGGSAKTVYSSGGASVNVALLMRNGDAFTPTYTVAPSMSAVPIA